MAADSMSMIMKPRFDFFRHRTPLLIVALLGQAVMCAAPPQPAAPAKAPAASAEVSTNVVLEIPQSVFVMPSATESAKDPFFPNSTRLAALVATTANTNRTAVIAADLVLKGLSGRADAPLATINNITFGVGEELEVRTSTGRIRVRCVEINLNDETVVIEAGGARRELRFPRRK